MLSLTCGATLRGARSSARAPRPISAGTVARSSSASPSSLAEPGSGLAVHGVAGRDVAGRLGCGVEQDGRDVHAGDPVDERVVGLGDQREAPARHALHEPDLPQRLGAVQALGEEPTGELLQRRLIRRPRQRGVADVVARVEVRVVGPHRPALAERDVGQPLAVARHQVQPAEHVIDQLLRRRRLALEDHHRRDVHVRGRVVLEMQERRVQRGQAVGVGHCSIVAASVSHVNVGRFWVVSNTFATDREVCPPSHITPQRPLKLRTIVRPCRVASVDGGERGTHCHVAGRRRGWGESAAVTAVTPGWRASVSRVTAGREPDS